MSEDNAKHSPPEHDSNLKETAAAAKVSWCVVNNFPTDILFSRQTTWWWWVMRMTGTGWCTRQAWSWWMCTMTGVVPVPAWRHTSGSWGSSLFRMMTGLPLLELAVTILRSCRPSDKIPGPPGCSCPVASLQLSWEEPTDLFLPNYSSMSWSLRERAGCQFTLTINLKGKISRPSHNVNLIKNI